EVSWEHYELEIAMRGEKPVPRMTYLKGALELMSPSKDHEKIASFIGRLIEVYCEERDIELSPYRSWTLKSGPDEAGGEPADRSTSPSSTTGPRFAHAVELSHVGSAVCSGFRRALDEHRARTCE